MLIRRFPPTINTTKWIAWCALGCMMPWPSLRADWPEFRGPSQNGTVQAAKLPTSWNEQENVRWFSKTEGLGWSSPVIKEERIYFTSAISPDAEHASQAGKESHGPEKGRQRLALVCINANDGSTLFTKEIFQQPENAPDIHSKNSHASPTPIIDGDRIFVHFGHQGTACTDLDGNGIWSNRDHFFPPTHGNGGSPIIADGNLIVTCDGGDSPYTLALDLDTGKEAWRTPRNTNTDKSFSFGTPQRIVVDGKPQIISPGSGIVQALSPDDGRVLWSVEHDGFSLIPRPLYYRDIVYLCTGYMAPKLLAIDPTGHGNVTKTHVRWSYRSNVPNTPSLVAIDDQIVMVSDRGIATGIHYATGKEVWQKRLGGDYSASPITLGKTIYFQSESGEATVARLDGKFQQIAKNSLPGRIFASYAVIDNDLIIRTEHGVYRIGNP